ncbi:hypothetical protein AB0G74_24600 [Streptomyces sp. NPDC020875]
MHPATALWLRRGTPIAIATARIGRRHFDDTASGGMLLGPPVIGFRTDL